MTPVPDLLTESFIDGEPVRSAATYPNVDPSTGIRDLHIPGTLQKTFEHGDCGVYAEVIAPGEIAVGDTVEAADLFAA